MYFLGDYKLCDGIKITATPGHTAEDVTVIVNGQFNGEGATIAITGPNFLQYISEFE